MTARVIPSWPRMRLTRPVWRAFMRRWRNGRGDAIGTETVAVTVHANGLASPNGVEEVAMAVEDLVPSPSHHLARLGGTTRAGAAAVAAVVKKEVVEAAVVVVAVNSEAMEVEGAEDAATVSCSYNKICLHLSKAKVYSHALLVVVLTPFWTIQRTS